MNRQCTIKALEGRVHKTNVPSSVQFSNFVIVPPKSSSSNDACGDKVRLKCSGIDADDSSEYVCQARQKQDKICKTTLVLFEELFKLQMLRSNQPNVRTGTEASEYKLFIRPKAVSNFSVLHFQQELYFCCQWLSKN